MENATAEAVTQAVEPVVAYSAHVSNIGWMQLVSGAVAGTTGRGLSMEALNLAIQNSEPDDAIVMNAHVSNIGWQGVRIGSADTTGQAKQMEAIRLTLKGDAASKYDLYYRVHCAELGCLEWAKNGGEAGSSGFGYGMQAIEIKLVSKGGAAPGKTNRRFVEATPYVSLSANVSGRWTFFGGEAA